MPVFDIRKPRNTETKSISGIANGNGSRATVFQNILVRIYLVPVFEAGIHHCFYCTVYTNDDNSTSIHTGIYYWYRVLLLLAAVSTYLHLVYMYIS